MTNQTKNLFALLSLSFGLAACGTEPDLTSYAPNPSHKLNLSRTPDGVTGTFQEDGVIVKFDFGHKPNSHHVVISTTNGFKLLHSLTINGVQSVDALETFHVSGPQKFDADALDDLAAQPEVKLLPDLKKALLDEGIDISSDIGEAGVEPIFCRPVQGDKSNFIQTTTIDPLPN